MRTALDDSFPDDLREAIEASPRARTTFQSLGRQNLYAVAFSHHQHEDTGWTGEENRRFG